MSTYQKWLSLKKQVILLKEMMITRVAPSDDQDTSFQPPDYIDLRNELVDRFGSRLPDIVRDHHTLDSLWRCLSPKIATYKERRRYLDEQFQPILNWLDDQRSFPSDKGVEISVERLNVESVRVAWDKMLERRATDPEGTITAARTLLESTMKSILDACGESYTKSATLSKLYKNVEKTLSIENDNGSKIFGQILGSCAGLISGIGQLRNELSDAHGAGAEMIRPERYHAELAANLAGAMASFLIQVYESKRLVAGDSF